RPRSRSPSSISSLIARIKCWLEISTFRHSSRVRGTTADYLLPPIIFHVSRFTFHQSPTLSLLTPARSLRSLRLTLRRLRQRTVVSEDSRVSVSHQTMSISNSVKRLERRFGVSEGKLRASE